MDLAYHMHLMLSRVIGLDAEARCGSFRGVCSNRVLCDTVRSARYLNGEEGELVGGLMREPAHARDPGRMDLASSPAICSHPCSACFTHNLQVLPLEAHRR